MLAEGVEMLFFRGFDEEWVYGDGPESWLVDASLDDK